METAARPAATVAAAARPANLAKGALRRLAQAQQEPTPENYARAYAEEAGLPPPAATAPAPAPDLKAQLAEWAALAERLAKGLDRSDKQWTAARRKDSVKRVFDSSRTDPARLQQRLLSLLNAWDGTDAPADVAAQAGDAAEVGVAAVAAPGAGAGSGAAADAWPAVVASLQGTVAVALPAGEERAADIAAELARLAEELATEGATPERATRIATVCEDARRLFGHRHRLVDELQALCRELGAGLTELAEDDSWARGQCESLQARLAEGPSVRGVRAATALLAETRQHQQAVRGERLAARQALQQLIRDMLLQVGEIGAQTGRFELATTQHAEAIARADSLQSLAGVVKSLLDDTRAVQAAVSASQDRLQADHARAGALEAKVRELEAEMRRLSDEVSTDALTQVANRRGLNQAFEAESARCERDGGATLAVGLIDIDNFKKLNDTLGHAAGDTALKRLAAAVRERLRPVDHLARFGGEEFVVLLPGTEIEEARQALSRLQRSLSEALFLHEGREVFVTFSAGVTPWRRGEALQSALERADEALYEAKRSGKNRTCIA